MHIGLRFIRPSKNISSDEEIPTDFCPHFYGAGGRKNYGPVFCACVPAGEKIGRRASVGCKKPGKVTIKSGKLKSVGRNTFKGNRSDAWIKVPSGKQKKIAEAV